MTDADDKKPGPKPELLKVPLAFEQAVDAALQTPLPKSPKKRKKKRKSG
jgi:hypothetical protein